MRTIRILALVALSSSIAASADPTPVCATAILDSSPAVTKPAETPKETGTAASEVLPGNGTRAGYILGHGDVIPGSEWVYVGVRRARPNTDYTIDYSSGSLYFAEAVRPTDAVRVDYRYTDTGRTERNTAAPGMLGFKFGGGLSTNLTYSYRAADGKSGIPDVLTYGFNTSAALGSSGSLSSMMYISTPQAANRLSLSAAAQATAGAAKLKKDHMMIQDADIGAGDSVRLKIGYQDIGEDFAGFASVRDSNASKADALAMLEKEKGIKRTDIGMQVATGTDSGLSVSTGRITDKLDSIDTQSLGYNSKAFRLSYSIRDIGQGFTRFNDLREADRAQLAAEAGVTRTNLGMQFATGFTSGTPVWSGFRISRLESDTGELTYESADIDLGRVKVQADVREADPGFGRMTALNDEERTRMALAARRQFDPNAQAAQIAAEDKTKINGETGLNRRNVGVQLDGGPSKIWLNLTDASSGKGKLSRRSVSIQGSSYTAYFGTQSIDEGFDKIASMQNVERARFGNEVGMDRREMGGTFKTGFGEIGLTHAGVSDYQGAGVNRNSLDFKGTRLKFHANFQDIDPRFSRIADLSDADRDLLAQERGFRRSDYAISFQANRALNIDSYVYSSTNSTAEQARSQNRYKIVYTPERGPKLTALSDDFSYISESGTLESYSHRNIAFDNKLMILGGVLFKGMHDVNSTRKADGAPSSAEITQTHFETNQESRTSYTLDTLQTDFGDNHRFEDTWSLGLKTQLARGFKLTSGFAKSAREDDNSESNGRVGFDWQVRNDLTMSLSVANRDGGPNGSQQARQFSMRGNLFKRLFMLRDVTIDSGTNTTQLRGKQVSCDNGLRMNAGMFGGKMTFDNSDKLNTKTGIYYTSRIVQYESAADPKVPYHLTFSRQNLITPSGEPAQKRNYALDFRLSQTSGFTVTSFYGKDGQNGAVLPLGGTVLKFTRVLNPKFSAVADFSTDLNESTNRHARTIGFGFTGTLPNNAAFEIYTGWCHLIEAGPSEHDRVFRIKYDRKIDATHFLSLTAQKKSAVERSAINPYEGDTTARLDFNTVFD